MAKKIKATQVSQVLIDLFIALIFMKEGKDDSVERIVGLLLAKQHGQGFPFWEKFLDEIYDLWGEPAYCFFEHLDEEIFDELLKKSLPALLSRFLNASVVIKW